MTLAFRRINYGRCAVIQGCCLELPLVVKVSSLPQHLFHKLIPAVRWLTWGTGKLSRSFSLWELWCISENVFMCCEMILQSLEVFTDYVLSDGFPSAGYTISPRSKETHGKYHTVLIIDPQDSSLKWSITHGLCAKWGLPAPCTPSANQYLFRHVLALTSKFPQICSERAFEVDFFFPLWCSALGLRSPAKS